MLNMFNIQYSYIRKPKLMIMSRNFGKILMSNLIEIPIAKQIKKRKLKT